MDKYNISSLFIFFKDCSVFMTEEQVRIVLFKYSTYNKEIKFICEESFYFLVKEHKIDISSLDI